MPLSTRLWRVLCLAGCLTGALPWGRAGADGPTEAIPLVDRLQHLRNVAPREWDDFPASPEAARLELSFPSRGAAREGTLILRQQDVRQTWKVRLNGTVLGSLIADENDLVVLLPVPGGTLRDGENRLEITTEPGTTTPDDIRVGEIRLDPRPRHQVVGEVEVEVVVSDAGTGDPTPARITVVRENGALQTLAGTGPAPQAVRPGVLYTGSGTATFTLPAGRYTLLASRGFEYSLARVAMEATPGKPVRETLTLRREVPTEGYVACDTHIHTVTFSGHGDASIEERMLTLAGEGIELPIATDHNRHIDFEPFARTLQVRRHFTPVAGNEVTTPFGHFNVFPVLTDAPPPDHATTDWDRLFHGIYGTPRVKGVILNHARDLHANIRPFGPRHYNAVVARMHDDRVLRANAMEIINSGAVQTDPLQLVNDWLGRLNSGRPLTPVGASDSHDVARYIVGQGRTYLRARDTDPGDIPVDEALTSFVEGRVLVSYGLLTRLTVADRYTSGDLVPTVSETLSVRIQVLGPHWTSAHTVRLYANGELWREAQIAPPDGSAREEGLLWQETWELPRPRHDTHLVVVALGPGIDSPHWPTARPYQPTSSRWIPTTLGVSGAVWLDVDGDGRPTPAVEYARAVIAERGHALPALAEALVPYDAAVAAQAADLAHRAGLDLESPEVHEHLTRATPAIQAGFARVRTALREIARARENSPSSPAPR